MTTTDILVARSVPCGKGIWEILGGGGADVVFCYSCLYIFFLAWQFATPKKQIGVSLIGRKGRMNLR